MCINFQSWDAYFRNVNNGAPPGEAYQSPPMFGGSVSTAAASVSSQPMGVDTANMKEVIDEHLAVQALIRGYQVNVLSLFLLSHSRNILLFYQTL